MKTKNHLLAILFGFDLCVELSAATLTDDLSDHQIRLFTRYFLLIPSLQRLLVLVFPFAISHCDLTSNQNHRLNRWF